MNYIDEYGVEFSEDRKTLLKCPKIIQSQYTIPNGVTSIGGSAFSDCKNLTSIKIHWRTTVPNDVAFDKENYAKATLYIPVGTVKLCKNISPWNEFQNIVQYDDSENDIPADEELVQKVATETTKEVDDADKEEIIELSIGIDDSTEEVEDENYPFGV